MLKISSIILGLFFITSNVFANACEVNGVDVSSDPTAFTLAIEASTSCYEASQLAEACAWGSSLDVMTVSAAYDVCSIELNSYRPDKKLKDLLSTMEETCSDKYMTMEGTMYQSMMSYCYLSAMQWIVSLAYPE